MNGALWISGLFCWQSGAIFLSYVDWLLKLFVLFDSYHFWCSTYWFVSLLPLSVLPVGSGIRLVLWFLCHMMTIWLGWFSVLEYAAALILLCPCMICSGNNPKFWPLLFYSGWSIEQGKEFGCWLSCPFLLFDVVPACSCGLVMVYWFLSNPCWYIFFGYQSSAVFLLLEIIWYYTWSLSWLAPVNVLCCLAWLFCWYGHCCCCLGWWLKTWLFCLLPWSILICILGCFVGIHPFGALIRCWASELWLLGCD
jgi:hypothetical protein